MNLIPRSTSKLNKFLKGGPVYFKRYGIDANKFLLMFLALVDRGLSNQVAFEITWQSNKEVPKSFYSFGTRFKDVDSWADNVVNRLLNRSIYKDARNATNFDEYRKATLPYNRNAGYTKWLLLGRDLGKGFINDYIQENDLGPLVVMNTPLQTQVLFARQGGIVKAQTGWTAYLNPFNWGVSRYDMDENGKKRTFNLAYKAARENGEEEFLFDGNRYNTKYEKKLPPAVKLNLGIQLDKSLLSLATDVWNYLLEKGVSPKNSAAIMGNIMLESSFIRNAKLKGGDRAEGLFLMHGMDLQVYNNWKANNKVGRFPEIDYVLYMIDLKDHPYTNEYKRVSADPANKDYVEKIYGDRIRNNTLYLIDDLNTAWNDKSISLNDITDLFTNTIERAGKPKYLNRLKYATDFYNYFHGVLP